MRHGLWTIVLGFGLLFVSIGCGGGESSPTAPYEDIVIAPDTTINGVHYYTYPILYGGSMGFLVQFSTFNGVWNMRLSSGDDWQTIETRLRLITNTSYTKTAAEKYLDEMGFEFVDWHYTSVPATYTVLLAEPAGAALSADVPLLAIIEAYLLRPDLFVAAEPITLSN